MSDETQPQPKRGIDLLRDPHLNKGTAFTESERQSLRLQGLLPQRVFTLDQQVARALENLRRKSNDLEKYIFLTSLQERNETLFYKLVVDHLEEMMPIIYTPTVGQACLEYGHIFRRPMGLYLSANDRGNIADVLRNWPHQDVRVIVVTDGERILGLGDLGADGMGIPVGKLSLYVACAGIDPVQCLPIMLDVGTNNDALLKDPLYIGLAQKRLRGPAYDEIVGEFIEATQQRWPGVLVQFEDFGNGNAFRVLRQYQDSVCCFNDDIQGTAAVALAGLYSAMRMTGTTLQQQRLLFFGAGEAGIGIGDLVTSALVADGLSLPDARNVCWFMDSQGLVVQSRIGLAAHKQPYAHAHPPIDDLLTAVEALRPTALIGVAGMAATFTQPVIEAMARINTNPIIFALSNPTSKAECTAAQAYEWTNGNAIFASGSPFDLVDVAGRRFVPGQGNNAYIFPGIGLGVIASRATKVSAEMFMLAAKTLAAMTSAEDLSLGRVYPAITRIREVSAAIAAGVATLAHDTGIARAARPKDIAADVQASMYAPTYLQADTSSN